MAYHFQVKALHIYPIKGMGGISLNHAVLTSRGFKYDRRWMLVDEHNQFISQRSFPNLCLFNVEIIEHGFLISYQKEKVTIPFELSHGPNVTVSVWEDKVLALLAENHINQFFSKQLSHPCKLVFMPDNAKRRVNQNYVKDKQWVSFADGYPILIIGQASMDLLNTKLKESIDVNRFRPNILFNGGEAHEEDDWKNFTIAGLSFKGIKPCARCQVPTINQSTSIKTKEPIKTLSTYRSFNNKINFGLNVISQEIGLINVGDEIIIEK